MTAGKLRDEKPCVKPLPAGEQHTKKLNEESNAKKPRAEEPHAGKPMTILKQQSNKLPELLPYLLPSTQGISKITSAPERKSTPQKDEPIIIPQKPKLNAKDKAEVKDKKTSVEKVDKPFDLALIGGAPFIYLVKSKKQRAEIFAISMRGIEY